MQSSKDQPFPISANTASRDAHHSVGRVPRLPPRAEKYTQNTVNTEAPPSLQCVFPHPTFLSHKSWPSHKKPLCRRSSLSLPRKKTHVRVALQTLCYQTNTLPRFASSYPSTPTTRALSSHITVLSLKFTVASVCPCSLIMTLVASHSVFAGQTPRDSLSLQQPRPLLINRPATTF